MKNSLIEKAKATSIRKIHVHENDKEIRELLIEVARGNITNKQAIIALGYDEKSATSLYANAWRIFKEDIAKLDK